MEEDEPENERGLLPDDRPEDDERLDEEEVRQQQDEEAEAAERFEPRSPVRLPTSVIRRLALPIYLPSFAEMLAQGIIIPVLPLYAMRLGADDAVAGAIVSMQGLGALCVGGIAGTWVGRVGERRGMVVGGGFRLVAAIAAAASPHIWLLFVARLLAGVGASFFQVARQSWLAAAVPNQHRGRVNSLIGGSTRLANVLGPIAGGMVSQYAGGSRSAFWLQALFDSRALHARMRMHAGVT